MRRKSIRNEEERGVCEKGSIYIYIYIYIYMYIYIYLEKQSVNQFVDNHFIVKLINKEVTVKIPCS